MAARAFDGPSREIVGRAQEEGNVGPDGGLSLEEPGEDETDRSASLQASRGAESVSSSIASEQLGRLPMIRRRHQLNPRAKIMSG